MAETQDLMNGQAEQASSGERTERFNQEKSDKGFDKNDKKKYFLKRKKKVCAFCAKGAEPISYKDEKTLRKYITENGRILPKRVTGTCQKHQREIVVAVKRARNLAILPYEVR